MRPDADGAPLAVAAPHRPALVQDVRKSFCDRGGPTLQPERVLGESSWDNEMTLLLFVHQILFIKAKKYIRTIL